MQNQVLKVLVSDSKSAKSSRESANRDSKGAILEPNIGTFGIGFCTLETSILDFRKVVFYFPLKGIRLELIQI